MMRTATTTLAISLISLLQISQISTFDIPNFQVTNKNQKSIFDLSDPDVSKSFKEIVEDNGYVFESHLVTTRDGYELKVFRIPGTKKELSHNSTSLKKGFKSSLDTRFIGKKVVFLQHGIFDSADCWVTNTKEKSPAFILSDLGYDVWLGNTRGNKYSDGHIDPFITNMEFNDFSFQEMGEYDIPAVLEYIEEFTTQKKVAYVGHSQGTAQLFYAIAMNEEYYKERISVFVALGPVTALISESTFLLKIFRSHFEKIMKWSKVFGIYDIMQPNFLTKMSSQLFCGYIPDLCMVGGLLSDDKNENINDKKRMGVYFSHYPSGSSIRSVEHLSQIKTSGKFQTYDFGKVRNLKEYGQETPLDIHIENISQVPIAMFVGSYDLLATQKDNQYAKEVMKKGVKFYKEYPLGHLAFFTANDMSYFKEDVVNVLKTYHAVDNKHQMLETVQKFLDDE